MQCFETKGRLGLGSIPLFIYTSGGPQGIGISLEMRFRSLEEYIYSLFFQLLQVNIWMFFVLNAQCFHQLIPNSAGKVRSVAFCLFSTENICMLQLKAVGEGWGECFGSCKANTISRVIRKSRTEQKGSAVGWLRSASSSTQTTFVALHNVIWSTVIIKTLIIASSFALLLFCKPLDIHDEKSWLID